MTNWENEKENIEKLISNGATYEYIGKLYGCTGANIKKQARKLGINLPERRKINPTETFNKGKGKKCKNCGRPLQVYYRVFCCDECREEYYYKESVRQWKNNEISGCDKNGDPRKFLRQFLYEKNNGKCEKCGYETKNPYTGKSILQIHHIDGDCYNNHESNLQLLCPNCHALTENFGSRNKNATRILWVNKNKPDSSID